jgi:hypothetical protein
MTGEVAAVMGLLGVVHAHLVILICCELDAAASGSEDDEMGRNALAAGGTR